MSLRRASTAALALRLFGASPERALALLRAAWPLAVGPELARRTELVAIEGDCLRIRVPDAGWRKGLLRMRREILGRLSQVAGAMAPRRLSFSEGFVARPAAEDTQRTAPSALAAAPAAALPLAPEITEAAAGIGDPDIRRRFLESAAAYLDRARSSR